MPEGPEVKRTAEILNAKFRGKLCLWISIDERSRYKKVGVLDGPGVSIRFPATVESIISYGKKIIFTFNPLDGSQTFYFVSLLGMEGHWQYEEGKHSGIKLAFGDCSKRFLIRKEILYYDDSRRYGRLYVHNLSSLNAFMGKIGPDLLSGTVTEEIYTKKIKSVKGSLKICSFMMEQKYFSGVGNYLKTEILYAAKISPHRILSSLSEIDISTLYRVTIEKIFSSYEKGGLTIATYRDPLGGLGTFEVNIYGKKIDPFGNKIIQEKIVSGRTTHWVPEIQI